jgi:hypothetical protein
MNETASPLASFLPIIILSVTWSITAFLLAKQKGRKPFLWAILALLPFINFLLIWYLIGASDLKHEEKINEIIERLKKLESKLT